MILSWIDWTLIILYLVLSFWIALRYRDRAGKNLGEFFLGGRSLPWFLAGISMVATTFAADTPLAVTELVVKDGVSGNWVWWVFLIGGMLTTFFFARLWRRAEVLTEVEFIELRYGGPAARFLRFFKSVYLGLFMNVIILGWVNLALVNILEAFMGVEHSTALLITAGAMLMVAVYSSLGGFMGVAVTDMVQFIIAMGGCILLAIWAVNSQEVGGITGLKEKLAAHPGALDILPNIGGGGIAGTLVITLGAFLAFVGVQWWASWYPGAEPGGGGYVAQRMMSTKTEKDSILATLFFQVAHYAIRPWPWILVALCALVLYSPRHAPLLSPDQAAQIEAAARAGEKKDAFVASHPEIASDMAKDPAVARSVDFAFNPGSGYVFVMKDFLPSGLRGLLLVAFLAAYMSTIATQLNWGASYLVNDFYRPMLRNRGQDDEDEGKLVRMSRVVTLLLMVLSALVTTFISSISGMWGFMMACGAGLGGVLILRWFWWRINAWAEITATFIPFLIFGFCQLVLPRMMDKLTYQAFEDQKGTYFITVILTTVAWILVMYLTPAESAETLDRFYTRVQPGGFWQQVRARLGMDKPQIHAGYLGLCWLCGVLMTYGFLFGTGKFIFQEYGLGLGMIAGSAVCGGVLLWAMGKAGIR